MKKSHNIVQRIAQCWVKPTVTLLLVTGSAYGGEFAVLTSGFRLHADRHETADGRVKLFEHGGVSEIAAADVVSFEAEDWVAPATVKAAPTPVVQIKAEAAKGDLFADSAKRHHLPEALVRSIVKAESNGNQKAVSPKGAIGLMQLMPGTSRDLGADPTIAEQNVDAGTRYLKTLLAKYENNDDQVARAVAAYNAGPAAVDKYKGIPPYRETQNYVRRVLTTYLKLSN